MTSLSIVAGVSNQWLREAAAAIAAQHEVEAQTSLATASALKLTATRVDQITYVPQVDTLGAVEHLINVAQKHGEDSEPDHEVGDLQDILRATWKVLTPFQRSQVLKSRALSEVLEGAAGEPLATGVDDTHDWDEVREHYGLDPSFQYSEDAILEFTNMFRLEALDPAPAEDAPPPRYVHGMWEHIFDEGRTPKTVRLIFDRESNGITAMEIKDGQGWVFAYSYEIADVEDSLKNANPEALTAPADFGLSESNEHPTWCANAVRRLTERQRA
jgi:hypothetical protein